MMNWAWTYFYEPFTMGGDVHQPRKCWLEMDGPHDLGGGFVGFLLTAPSGKTFVVEAQSHALIGPDLETVRADVRAAKSVEVMNKQVLDACVVFDKATKVSEEDWWRRLDK